MSYGAFQLGEIVEFDVQDHGNDPRDDVFTWTCEAKISGVVSAGEFDGLIYLVNEDGSYKIDLAKLRRVNPRVGDLVRVRAGLPHITMVDGLVRKIDGDLVSYGPEGVEAEEALVTEIYVSQRATTAKTDVLRYDDNTPVQAGDLIASESGVPGRIIEIIPGCKKTVCTSFQPGQRYHRLVAGLQFVQRGTLTPIPDTSMLDESGRTDFGGPLPNQMRVPEAPLTMGHSGLDPITKDTNPKDALAGFKPRWFSFIPLRVLIGVGKAMFEGGWKYGKHNYRESGVRASVYLDATVCGHLMPFMEGQDFDENGMHHLDKAIASLMVLRDAQLGSNWIDDRPLAAKGFDEQVERETAHFQTMKAELKAKFGDPVAPYTEATRGQPR